ncbi:hypothetical protein GCM10027578_01830 [Spirosoma luteolum]
MHCSWITARRADSTQLVFELPLSAQKPHLWVRSEQLTGDLFDSDQPKHTRVRLF